MKNMYMNYGLFIFNQMAKEIPPLEANRNSIEQFIDGLVDNHIGTIEKYGESESLDKIFNNELIKYYNVVLGADENVLKTYMNKLFISFNLLGYSNEVDECAIIYPAFKHKEHGNGMVSHIPIADFYLIKEKDIQKVNNDKDDNSLENLSNNMFLNCDKIAKIWTKGKKPNNYEMDLVSKEVMALLTFESTAAYKQDVITYLAEECEMEEMLRFL